MYKRQAIAGSDITIAWTTPDGNGYAVSKEEIHYSTDGGSTWNILIQDLTTPSHTDPNLTNGQTYHYKTKSYNALGWSAFSASANASYTYPTWQQTTSSSTNRKGFNHKITEVLTSRNDDISDIVDFSGTTDNDLGLSEIPSM